MRRSLHRARNPNPDSKYPPGVQIDQAYNEVASTNSIDRILSNQKIEPAYLENVMRFVGKDILRVPYAKEVKSRTRRNKLKKKIYQPGLDIHF